MKIIIITLMMVFGPSISIAKLCPGPYVNENHKEYNKQKSFIKHIIEPSNGILRFEGLIDPKTNDFHIMNSIAGSYNTINVKLNFDFASRRAQKNFVRNCSSDDKDNRSMINIGRQRARTDSKFTIVADILPQINSFEDRELILSSLKSKSYGLELVYKNFNRVAFEKATSSEGFSVAISKKLNKGISKDQIKQHKLELDLTGQDEILCDLINGDAELKLTMRYDVKNKIVNAERHKLIETENLVELASAISDSMDQTNKRSKNMFYAGATYLDFAIENNFSRVFPKELALPFVNYLTNKTSNVIEIDFADSRNHSCMSEYGTVFVKNNNSVHKVKLNLYFDKNSIFNSME